MSYRYGRDGGFGTAMVPPYGTPAVRELRQRMGLPYSPYQDQGPESGLSSPADSQMSDYEMPGQDTSPPPVQKPGFFSRALHTIRSHPREAAGFVGSIMGIPQGGGFVEGLQGGLGGYEKGVGSYDKSLSDASMAEREIRVKEEKNRIDRDALGGKPGEIGRAHV